LAHLLSLFIIKTIAVFVGLSSKLSVCLSKYNKAENHAGDMETGQGYC
jgi:hypothetical protein